MFEDFGGYFIAPTMVILIVLVPSSDYIFGCFAHYSQTFLLVHSLFLVRTIHILRIKQIIEIVFLLLFTVTFPFGVFTKLKVISRHAAHLLAYIYLMDKKNVRNGF